MAKNSESSKKKQENRVCEKIFRAVTSPVRTVRRKPSSEAEGVHVKFSETSRQTPKPITKMEAPRKLISRVDTTMKTDERFTDFIKKAKLKIRAMTNLGEETSSETQSRDHYHVPISHVSRENSSDQFSDFIKKAKKKLASSSTIARANPTYKN